MPVLCYFVWVLFAADGVIRHALRTAALLRHGAAVNDSEAPVLQWSVKRHRLFNLTLSLSACPI
jgi:hypothetical protein